MVNRTLLDWLVLAFQRTLLLWLITSSLVAYRWKEWFPGALDPFVKANFTNTHLYVTIAVTMLAIGSMLPRDEVRQVLRRWPMTLAGTAIQYTSMPLLAYLAARLFGFEGDRLIGVIIVGCVPGAMASNVLTLIAGGNASYSVSLTTTATLLSPLAVPLALGIALAGQGQVERWMLVQSSGFLLVTVVLPVILGHLLARQRPAWQDQFQRWGSLTANLAILLIIAVVVGRNRERLANYELIVMSALLMVNLCGYLVGYFGGQLLRLSEPMRRALTLEVGMQNAGVGTALALNLFSDQAAIAPAMYTFGCMLTGTLLAFAWSLLPRSGVRNP